MKATGLTLRPIERSDLLFLRDLANDPVVRANVVGWDWPLSLDAQDRWFDKGVDTESTRRFIVADENGIPVGVTGLWDIDWHNRTAMSAVKIGGDSSFRGRGFGAEAVRRTMDFAFNDVGLHRLHAQILEFNEASLSIYLEKCGWVREGLARQHVWRNGRYWDVIQLGILKDEYDEWIAAKNEVT